jgi:hypothetical protein
VGHNKQRHLLPLVEVHRYNYVRQSNGPIRLAFAKKAFGIHTSNFHLDAGGRNLAVSIFTFGGDSRGILCCPAVCIPNHSVESYGLHDFPEAGFPIESVDPVNVRIPEERLLARYLWAN